MLLALLMLIVVGWTVVCELCAAANRSHARKMQSALNLAEFERRNAEFWSTQ